MGASLWGAPTASALVCTPINSVTCPHNLTGNGPSLKGLLAGDTTANANYGSWSTIEDSLNGESGTTAKTVRTGLWRGRVAAGTLPTLGVALGRVTLVGSALVTGIEIGRALDTHVLGLTVDGGIFGGVFATGGTGYQAIGWEPVTCGTSPLAATSVFGAHSSGTVYACTGTSGFTGYAPTSGFVGWMQTSDLGQGGGGTGDGTPDAQLAGYNCPTPSSTIFGGAFMCGDMRAALSANYIHGLNPAVGTAVVLYTALGSCCGAPGQTQDVYTRLATTAVMDSRVTDARWRDGDDTTHDRTATWTPAGAETVTDPELATGIIEFESPSSTPGEWIDATLDPDYSDPLHPDIAWPKPNPNETYTEYTDRLTTLGILGTVTVLDPLTEYDPGYGPDSPVRIRIKAPSGATVRVLDPLAWPVSDPVFPDNYTTEITPNPSDAPPVSDNETTPCSGYLTADVDFTPITDLDLGNKFPFGIFGYMYDVIAPIDVSPVTPYVNWDIQLSALSDDPYTFEADAHRLDSFMGTMRILLAIFLTIGAIYLVATSFFKLNIGNPGSAADDEPGYGIDGDSRA